MWRNYLKVGWRNLVRDRLYTGINILGLVTGLVSFLLIALYIQDELSYDKYHSKNQRTYRLWEVLDFEGAGERSSSMQFPVAPALLNDYPHLIDEAVRFFNFQRPVFTLQVEDLKFNEENIFFADSGAFRVFDWPLLSGDPENVLAAPNTIVLDEELARKYFGDEDPVGRDILMEGGIQLKVGGVMKPVPHQSHFQPRALISFITLKSMMGPNLQSNNWVWNPCWTYLLLKDGVKTSELTAQFPAFVEKYYPDFMSAQTEFHLMPLADIHLESHLEYEIRPNHQRSYLYILGVIGVIILVIAGINFTNLSTARSTRRAREVGVRKVMGASKEQLVVQFLTESLILVFLSVLTSLALITLLLPAFNTLAEKEILFGDLLQTRFLLFFICTGLLMGILAGLYPAFYLSSFRPALVLKGAGARTSSRQILRRGLVIFQFSLGAALIVGTLVVTRQFHYMQSKDPGFDESRIIVMGTKQVILPRFEAFRTEVLANPAIERFTVMNDILGEDHNVFEYNYEGIPPDQWQYLATLIVDEDFVETMGLELVAGRDLDRDIKSDDTAAVLVNETLVREMGWGSPQDALGKRMTTPRGKERVVGVLKDFHYVSLNEPIRPFVLDMISRQGFWIQEFAVRVAPGKTEAALTHLEEVWSKFAPQFPFDYFFLEDRLDRLYRGQNTLRLLVGLFSIIAVAISCIGLFALASLSIEQRTKEIGIRKILGAEAMTLVRLIGNEFMMLVGIAFLVAIPFAYWALNKWLAGFAYRIDFDWWSVLLAGVLSLFIAALTISYHAWKVTRTDPVLSLRHE